MAKQSRRKRFILILGVKVKIRYLSNLMCETEDEPLDGAFCAQTMTIFISTKSDIHSTLLHECGHAALAISGVNQMLTNKVEESIVCALESALKDYFVF